MNAEIDKTLADILRKFGANPQTDIWNCHGTWVAYHKTLERIASKANIKFDLPQVIRSEHDECVVLVSATLGEREEWSFGEARIGLNYKVSGKQAGYPYAMAEKRGKDRVILKLIGLSGYVYSEEEADSFKNPPKSDQLDQDMDARTVFGNNKTSAQAKRDGDGEIVNEMQQCSNAGVLHDWLKANEERIRKMPVAWQNHFWPAYDIHYENLTTQ